MNNELKISGKVKEVFPEKAGEGKRGKFVKQDFTIITSDQYPKLLCFEAWKDLTNVVSNLLPDDLVTISFNPESREYNGKHYTTLKAWKIQKEESKENNKVEIQEEEETDLPF